MCVIVRMNGLIDDVMLYHRYPVTVSVPVSSSDWFIAIVIHTVCLSVCLSRFVVSDWLLVTFITANNKAV